MGKSQAVQPGDPISRHVPSVLDIKAGCSSGLARRVGTAIMKAERSHAKHRRYVFLHFFMPLQYLVFTDLLLCLGD